MDLTTEYLDTHEARLTVVVDEATLKEAQNKTARALSKRMHIPGFRPGHAPTAMVIRAIGGPQAFALEVADTLAREIYPKVLDQAQVNPYGPGKIEDVQQDPFRIVFRVPLQPKVDLKDYRSIRLPYPSVSVTEEDIQRELMALREEHAIVETVERPAQFGDMVEADIFLVSEAEQAEQASAAEAEEEPTKFQSADEPFVLNPEETSPLMRQIIEAVVGMSAGEEKTITAVIQYTTSDPPQSDEFKLRIALRRVSSRTLPEISDELAQTVGSFTTLAELREDIRRRLLERRQSAAESAYTDQVVQAFAELAEVKMPPDLIEDRLNEAMDTYKDTVKRKVGLPFEEWLKLRRQTEDEVREELRQDVIQRLRRGLVMRELAAAERLTVTPEEREQEIERRIAQYLATGTTLTEDQLRRLLHRPEQIEDIVNEMLSQKVIDRMVAIARGEAEAQPSPEQAAPEPASAG